MTHEPEKTAGVTSTPTVLSATWAPREEDVVRAGDRLVALTGAPSEVDSRLGHWRLRGSDARPTPMVDKAGLREAHFFTLFHGTGVRIPA